MIVQRAKSTLPNTPKTTSALAAATTQEATELSHITTNLPSLFESTGEPNSKCGVDSLRAMVLTINGYGHRTTQDNSTKMID